MPPAQDSSSLILRTILEAIPAFAGNLLAAALLLLAFFLVRMIAQRRIAATNYTPDAKRRLLVNVRNASIVLLIAGMVVIWAPQFRAVAAGLLLVISAVVLATKELIMCLTGSLVRVLGGTFVVGDRIEIGSFRGDVVDVTFFSTRILEVGPGQVSHQRTGRIITLPNSMFLTAAVVNEAMANRYVLHPIAVPLRKEEDWEKAEHILLEIAQAECGPYLEEARALFSEVARKHALDLPTVDPRVLLTLKGPDQVELLLRLPVPARAKGRIQEAVLRQFLSRFRGAGPKAATP
jgi:small-conductance mechanosensitive channel